MIFSAQGTQTPKWDATAPLLEVDFAPSALQLILPLQHIPIEMLRSTRLNPRKMQRQLIVAEQRLDNMPHPRLPTQHQPENIRPSKQTHPRAQRQRLRNVRSGPDAGVEEDVELVAHGVDDTGEDAEGADAAVDLAAAVVADDDAVDAVGDAGLGIGDGLDAFEDDGPVPVGFEESEVGPAVA